MNVKENLINITKLLPNEVTLVAVSKTKPNEMIEEAYAIGQRHFGENKVQDLVEKQAALPEDIRWHFIGHLQTNKVKYIAPFVHLIHAVDSLKLAKEIDKRASQHNRVISVLIQAKIASENTKFGLSFDEIKTLLSSTEFQGLQNIKVVGLMGMATNTDNLDQVKSEFRSLKSFAKELISQNLLGQNFNVISMGMSNDFQLAIEEGSNMVRIGSTIFGARNYSVPTK